ncbi:MAG: hypothetical protein M3Y77_01380 [Actinomycetota bacterium]|nr:hypothetical protein [Actinomycetota bacterium]
MNDARAWFGNTTRPATVTMAGWLAAVHGIYLLLVGAFGTVLTVVGVGYGLRTGDAETRGSIGLAAPAFVGWPLLIAVTGVAVLLVGRKMLIRRRRWPIIGLAGWGLVVAVPWLIEHVGGLLAVPGFLLPIGVIALLALTDQQWRPGFDSSPPSRIGGFD